MYSTMFLCALALTVAPDAAASQWTGFRNDGASQAVAGALPLTWSPTTNIAWQCELPGYGQSAPVVWNEVVYATAVEGPQKETCLVLALSATSGKTLWRVKLPASTTLPSNYSVARAAPTPVVDAHGVYAFFEGGDLVATNHAGELQWKRSLTDDYGPFDNHHGLGSSPAQTADAIFLNVQHRGPSYLLCLDKRTGQVRWKIDRPSSMSWSSPLIVKQTDKTLVIVSSGGSAEAYDVANGQQVWSLGEVSGNSVPSPTYFDGHVLLGAALSDFGNSASAAKSNLCLKLTAEGYEVLWRAKRALCDYASPVVCGDYAYYVSRVGVVYCLDRHTGKEQFSHRLPGPCWATPIVSGEHIYFFGKDGQTTVLKAASRYTEVAKNTLWDLASPPQPESYTETPGGRGHGAEGAAQPGERSSFVKMLLAFDKNQDERVDANELPEDYQQHLSRDTNGDGALDVGELTAMAEEFRKRRQEASAGSHDPTVYGVAATERGLFIRCGTRLFCVRK